MTYYCGACKEPCEGQFLDFGIGPYEFWGAKSCDIDIHWVSECCEADIYEDKECTVLADEPEQDEGPDRRSDGDY